MKSVKRSKRVGASAVYAALFLLLVSGSARAEVMSVKGSTVNLRFGPGKEYEVMCKYGAGFPVNVVERKDGWLKVKDFEDDSGWISDKLVSDTQYVIIKTSRGRKSKVNIRQEPSRKSDIIGKGYYGVVLKKLAEKSGWTEVEHESGVRGWIKSDFLWGLQG